jgi:uncharacterized tellurite resistance protein B-like protein
VQLNVSGNADLATLLLAQSSLAMTPLATPKPTAAATTIQPDIMPLSTDIEAIPVLYDMTAPSEWLPLLPTPLVTAARSPFDARLLIYRLVLADEPTIRLAQQHLLEQEASAVLALTSHAIPCGLRLALVELTIPALKELTMVQYQAFHDKLWQLIQADEQTSFAEWLLYRMLKHQLAPHFSQQARQNIQYRELQALAPAIEQWLSYLSQQTDDATLCERIFAAGCSELSPLSLRLQPRPSQETLAESLDQLQLSSPAIRFRFLQALVKAIESDGKISSHEAELFQMLAYCLDCPLPPPQVFSDAKKTAH